MLINPKDKAAHDDADSHALLMQKQSKFRPELSCFDDPKISKSKYDSRKIKDLHNEAFTIIKRKEWGASK